jgi:enhancing lycopene biosynthesis protein 2
MHVINHLTGEESAAESRNVLIESARIARGDVLPLEKYNAADYDAIVFPGGFGAAKNLSTFAVDGTDCTVHEQVKAAIVATVEAQKPVGALCIAPVLLAQVLGDGVVTIGQDEGVAAAIEAFGATHLDADHEEVVLDPNLKLVTTPCYMLDAHIGQIAKGASAVVKEVLHLCA